MIRGHTLTEHLTRKDSSEYATTEYVTSPRTRKQQLDSHHLKASHTEKSTVPTSPQHLQLTICGVDTKELPNEFISTSLVRELSCDFSFRPIIPWRLFKWLSQSAVYKVVGMLFMVLYVAMDVFGIDDNITLAWVTFPIPMLCLLIELTRFDRTLFVSLFYR